MGVHVYVCYSQIFTILAIHHLCTLMFQFSDHPPLWYTSAFHEDRKSLFVYQQPLVFFHLLGHLKAVRDICFNNDGTQFLSASYDRYVKLWDTETGKCIGRFSNQKTPYCIKFNPDEDKQHLFVVGCSDKKIYTVSE